MDFLFPRFVAHESFWLLTLHLSLLFYPLQFLLFVQVPLLLLCNSCMIGMNSTAYATVLALVMIICIIALLYTFQDIRHDIVDFYKPRYYTGFIMVYLFVVLFSIFSIWTHSFLQLFTVGWLNEAWVQKGQWSKEMLLVLINVSDRNVVNVLCTVGCGKCINCEDVRSCVPDWRRLWLELVVVGDC